MNTRITYAVAFFIVANVISCTNTRWTVQDPAAVDYSDYEIIQNQEFLKEIGSLSPDDPTLKLQLFSHVTYEYAEKVLVRRSIQDYRPRPGLMALGLVGAALSVYAANSDIIAGNNSPTKKFTFYTAGSLLALTGFLSMKPVGEPRDTGEERFLRKTGTTLQADTVKILSSRDKQAYVTIKYGDRVIQEEEKRSLKEGLLEIDLGNKLNSLKIQGNDTEQVNVSVRFQDSTYVFENPLERVLSPFARLTSPITILRNKPVEQPNSVLAELIRSGQLRVIGEYNDKWYKVLYGISENYILKKDAKLIWQTSELAQNNQVIAVPRIPFGNIDVETNIPILRAENARSAALIITNENYQGKLKDRTYAHRDGQLIQTYLNNALGFQPANIFNIQDLNDVQQLSEPLSRLDAIASDSTELFVFLSGYGSINLTGRKINLGFIPAGSSDKVNLNNTIPLSDFFRRIASIPSKKTIVVVDIDFNHPSSESVIQNHDLYLRQPLRRLSHIITGINSNSAVLFSSQLGQKTAIYVNGNGQDKKHRIFPYFLARAIQLRHTNLAEIYQYLERNVSYYARRFHDHPQDPQLFGKISIDLVSN